MRRLASFEHWFVSAIAGGALLLALGIGGTGCDIGSSDDEAGEDDGDNPQPGDTPPPGTDIPAPAVYKRGSLVPLFQLAQQETRDRIDPFGISMQVDDFLTLNESFTSVQDKMNEIEAQIEAERGEDVTVFLSNDELTADDIPFRGNPSSVANVIGADNLRKVVVPLGGDLGTPGNELAIVDPEVEIAGGDGIELVKVGVMPTRVAVHEQGIAFVCNKYSNYISIVDVAQQDVLRDPSGNPVEIPTYYYCSDVLLVENQVGGEQDVKLKLMVANEYYGAVLRYDIKIEQDPLNGDRVSNVTIENPNDPINIPQGITTGVGNNPIRLRLDDQGEKVYVANGRGGTCAHMDPKADTVLRTFNVGAPCVDALNIDQSVFVPTTQQDRGFLKEDEQTPQEVQANPLNITGVDGSNVEAHPGALFDETFAYNFQDLRNSTVQLDRLFANEQEVYIDDVDPEVTFVQQQKVLNGGLPVSAERDLAGGRLFLAMSGTDHVQTLNVNGGTGFRLENAGVDFITGARPFAMQVVEELVDRDDNVVEFNELTVVNWGQDTLQIFDIDSGAQIVEVDLNYAELGTGAEYPANNVEGGEYLYYNTTWSNTGRISCTSCHGPDNLISDGMIYGNGATAPTAGHSVRPNFNLLQTENYFWTGMFDNGSYASLAFDAQTRPNCENILFALEDGPSTLAQDRVGDPNLVDGFTGGAAADAICQPDAVDPAVGVPPNFFDINGVLGAAGEELARQKITASQTVVQRVRLLGGVLADPDIIRDDSDADGVPDDNDVSRFVDFYSTSELRIPANPLKRLWEAGELGEDDVAKLELGQATFEQAGCGGCHNPDNGFVDDRQHGQGADWMARFLDEYNDDARVEFQNTGVFEDAVEGDPSEGDKEINIHQQVDFFMPFCFADQAGDCLRFQDPLAVTGDNVEESRRLLLIQVINLADPNRGFVPGTPDGAGARINTPSLRSVWWMGQGYLHHGLARNIQEATLPPGHPALREGERGFATTSGSLDFNVHGNTQDLSAEQIDAMSLYVESLE